MLKLVQNKGGPQLFVPPSPPKIDVLPYPYFDLWFKTVDPLWRNQAPQAYWRTPLATRLMLVSPLKDQFSDFNNIENRCHSHITKCPI